MVWRVLYVGGDWSCAGRGGGGVRGSSLGVSAIVLQYNVCCSFLAGSCVFALVSLTGFVLFSIYIVVIAHGSDTRLYSDIVFYSGMLLCWVWGGECVCVGVVGDRVDVCWVVCGGLASGYVILCGLWIPCRGGGSVVEGSGALRVGRWCFVGAYAAQTLPRLCVGNSGPHGGSSTRPPKKGTINKWNKAVPPVPGFTRSQ